MACIDQILKDFKDLSKEELNIIEKELTRLNKKFKNKSPETARLDIENAARELAELVKIQTAIQKRSALESMRARISMNKRVEGAVAADFKTKGLIFDTSKEFEGIQSLIVGSTKLFEGAQLHADGLGKALSRKFTGSLFAEIEKELDMKFRRFEKLTRDRKFNRDLVHELANDEFKQPVTGNDVAFKMAKIINKHKDLMVDRVNIVGGNMGKMRGHIDAQFHNVINIGRMGRQKWKALIRPLLDEERMIRDSDIPKNMIDELDVDVFNERMMNSILDSSYDNVRSGLGRDALGAEQRFARGIGSLARRISRARVLHFRDADSVLKYNEAMGGQTPLESIIGRIDHLSDQIALMETFGPDPESAFNGLLKKFKSGLNRRQVERLKAQFDLVTGKLTNPADPYKALISSWIKDINNMSFLGFSGFTALSDVAYGIQNLKFHGVGYLDAYHSNFTKLLKGRSKGIDRDRMLTMMATGVDSIRGSFMRRFAPQASVPGKMANATHTFFKLNRLTWITDIMKEAQVDALSHHLGLESARPFNQIEKGLKNSLIRHGITEQDWRLLGKGKLRIDDGRTFLTPDAVKDIPDEAFINIKEVLKTGEIARQKGLKGEEPFTGKQLIDQKKLARFKEGLEERLRNFYSTEADVGSPTPGAKELNLLRGRTQAGTTWGEFVALFGQFKTFPITIATKVLPRLREAGLPGAAHFILLSTSIGYLALMIKDVLKGKTPRKPSVQSAIDALVAGGGGGIYMDYVFRDYNEYNRGFLPTALGPTAGRVESIAKIYSSIARGDPQGAGAKSLRLIMDSSPFGNLWASKLLLDWSIIWGVQEMLNPGSLRRIERKLEKGGRQNYIISPESALLN